MFQYHCKLHGQQQLNLTLLDGIDVVSKPEPPFENEVFVRWYIKAIQKTYHLRVELIEHHYDIHDVTDTSN